MTRRNWQDADVMAKYQELSSAARAGGREHPAADAWRERCRGLLRRVWREPDAEPFRAPVRPADAPDYRRVVRRPCDLALVRRRLRARKYAGPDQFCADVRRIFENSRLYNTNKKSQIYRMTARLAALFEELWQNLTLELSPSPRRTRAGRLPARKRPRPASSGSPDSGSERSSAASEDRSADEYSPLERRRKLTRRVNGHRAANRYL